MGNPFPSHQSLLAKPMTGWWFGAFFIFHFIYGMSSFPLTNSIIFQDGFFSPPTRYNPLIVALPTKDGDFPWPIDSWFTTSNAWWGSTTSNSSACYVSWRWPWSAPAPRAQGSRPSLMSSMRSVFFPPDGKWWEYPLVNVYITMENHHL